MVNPETVQNHFDYYDMGVGLVDLVLSITIKVAKVVL